ncbi:hypothetical protein NYE24_30535 [Paenibacillus sp. FSL H7-0350]|uniref:DUF6843 domain-containing protein n=1 Tax=Paenibacillus sp. FSL H7-0350 TaxID=2975345 RepID=UPI0031596380
MKKTLLLLIPLLLLVLAFCSTYKRNPNIYLIPNNYVGWVQIIYNQEGFKEFYYYDEQNKQQKLDTDQMIHRHTIGNGESVSNSGKIEGPMVQRFFVGTEAELQNHPAPDYPVELMK